MVKGLYRHFKGHTYEVLGIARHSENLEEFVVYRPADDPDNIWIRPKGMFFETIERDGKKIKRFQKI